MTPTNPSFVVTSVSTVAQRDAKITAIHNKLLELNNLSEDVSIVKEGVNKINVYHKVKAGARILLRTYLVVMIPVQVNLSAIEGMYGTIYFDLNDTIELLQKALSKLRALEGQRTIKTPISTKESLKQILDSLVM